MRDLRLLAITSPLLRNQPITSSTVLSCYQAYERDNGKERGEAVQRRYRSGTVQAARGKRRVSVARSSSIVALRSSMSLRNAASASRFIERWRLPSLSHARTVAG